MLAPPAFKYRGVFTNDEDLLGYFRRDPMGEAVFDLRASEAQPPLVTQCACI